MSHITEETDRTAQFEGLRALLFSIAYRMLGSVMEAEDMVQETYLRWLGRGNEPIKSPKAYLTTVVTRLCLDQLKSARHQRETYVGPWLPEPLLTTGAPAVIVDRYETISLAFLTLLDELTPVERAVFVLREVFDETYADIASIVDKSEANCRQLFSRAHRRLDQRSPGSAQQTATAPQQQELLGAFLQTLADGNVERLSSIFAEDVRFWSDGGGKVTAATRPLAGREKVSAFFLGIYSMRTVDTALEIAEVNGSSAWVISGGGQILAVIDFVISGHQIHEIRAIRNPEKLLGFARQRKALSEASVR